MGLVHLLILLRYIPISNTEIIDDVYIHAFRLLFYLN